MPRLIWVLAGRTVILLVLSWGGSYTCIKLPSSSDLRSQWPPESRRVPRGCNCWGVCSYIDAQELLLRHMFLGCNCIYKHFVETKIIVFRFEPPHDKTNKMTVRPAKTQISLGIHPVWPESLLCSQLVAKDPSWGQRRLWSDWADAHAGWSQYSLGAHAILLVLL